MHCNCVIHVLLLYLISASGKLLQFGKNCRRMGNCRLFAADMDGTVPVNNLRAECALQFL